MQCGSASIDSFAVRVCLEGGAVDGKQTCSGRAGRVKIHAFAVAESFGFLICLASLSWQKG